MSGRAAHRGENTPIKASLPTQVIKWLVRSLNEYVTYKKYDILYRMVARPVHV